MFFSTHQQWYLYTYICISFLKLLVWEIGHLYLSSYH